MIEELENEIAILNDEYLEDKTKFNERLNNNPIGLFVYHEVMKHILFLNESVSPVDAACIYYKIFSGLFDFAEKIKAKHPEYSQELLTETLERFCITDTDIREYMIGHLHIPAEDNLSEFAHSIVDMYNTLVSLEFLEIIAKEKQIAEKNAELTSLIEEENAPLYSALDSVENALDVAGDVTRGFINKGAKKLIKVMSKIIEKTDKK